MDDNIKFFEKFECTKSLNEVTDKICSDFVLIVVIFVCKLVLLFDVQVKEMCRRELERLEADNSRNTVIIADYKQVLTVTLHCHINDPLLLVL